MWKRISVAVVLSSVVVWHVLTTSPKVFASDQTATTLIAIEATLSGMSAKVSGLDATVSEMGKQERASHAALIRRMTDDESKITELTNSLTDLDAFRENQNYVSLASRTSAIETKLDIARQDRERAATEAKADHDSTMWWVRSIAMLVSGTLLTALATLGLGHLRDGRADRAANNQNERLDKLELPPENPEQ